MLPGNVLYEMSSWTRSILVPLSIVQARGANRRAPAGFNLDELLLPRVSLALPKRWGLSVLFHQLDRVFKVWEKRGSERIRAAAIREAERWILTRTRHTEGLGAIYPAMMYFIMALDALDYAQDHPDRVEAIRHFESLLIETEDRFIFQPCVSPIWDTAICAFAMGEAGVQDDARLTRAADWLISKEVRRKGDWSIKRPDTEPSGWAFEFANEFYPDIDDTAMVLLALMHAKASNADAQAACERRAINWLLAMQSGDGGWAAFDVDNNWAVLNQVPFADHNAMLDPTCPDITGRVLECLCRRGMTEHEAVRRGVAYLLGAQEKDGSWYGRWGVNYIYGSFLAMRGLAYSKSQGTGRCAGSGGQVAAGDPESGRRVGRILRQLRARLFRAGAQFGIADGLGVAGAAGRGRQRVGAIPAGRRISSTAANRGWQMARRGYHRHRISQRVLPHLRDVPGLLSVAGALPGVAVSSPKYLRFSGFGCLESVT